MTDTPIWELAHPDGSSIFIRQTKEGDPESITYGPFLFFSEQDLEQWQGTHGPWDLLHPLVGHSIRAQQISLEWVVQSAFDCFGPAFSDCVIVSDIIIPLTAKGAAIADTLQNNGRKAWTEMAKHWGEPGMRCLNTNLIAKLVTPSALH